MTIDERIAALQENISLVSTVGAEFIHKVYKRLESLGYTATESDDWTISFAIQKVENNIKNSCNITLIPDGLIHTAIDMICGEFLFTKKGTGKLIGFNLEAAVKQIQEGDTSVTFAIGSGTLTLEQRLDSLIAYLMNRGKNDFSSFRCMKW